MFKCGDKIGKVLLIEQTYHKNRPTWICRCDCGKEFITKRSIPISGCGCDTPVIWEHEIGKRYGRLTIKEIVDNRAKAICDCGTLIDKSLFIMLNLKSCGCERNKNPVEVGINRLLKEYKTNAVSKELTFSLTRARFEELVLGNCYYCGVVPSNRHYRKKHSRKEVFFNGIDRIDSQVGYIDGNTVTACKICNLAKNELTLGEFKRWVTRVVCNKGVGQPTSIYSHLARALIAVPDDQKRNFEIGWGIAKNAVEYSYKSKAKEKELKFGLTEEEFNFLIGSDCYYCSSGLSNMSKYKEPYVTCFNYNGIDRVDNNQGYFSKNCVTCCRQCNSAKKQLNVEEFLVWCRQVFKHLKLGITL